MPLRHPDLQTLLRRNLAQRKQISSATLAPTLWLMCTSLLVLGSLTLVHGTNGGSTSSSPYPQPAATANSSLTNPAPRYAIIDLGTNQSPLGLSDTGYVVLESGEAPAGPHVFSRWYQGTSQVLSTVTSESFTSNAVPIGGIANDGTIIGYASVARTTSVWNSEYSDLGIVSTTIPVAWSGTSTSPLLLPVKRLGPSATDLYVNAGASSIDQNTGVIYGETSEGYPSLYAVPGFQPSNPDEWYDGIQQGVSWANSSSPDTLLGPLTTIIDGSAAAGGTHGTQPAHQDPSNVLHFVSISKSGQTLGWESTNAEAGPFFPTENGSPITPANFTPTDINTNGTTIGYVGNSPSTATYGINQGGNLTIIPGASSLYALNYATRSAPGSTNQVACPQIIGYDSSNDPTLYQFNPATTTYDSPLISSLISTNWAFSPSYINNSGAIVGTATYSGTNYPTGSHGILMLPCQLSLLNGSTNASDVDGKFFDGTRSTTISATSPDNTAASQDQTDNGGIDQLGTITLGQGRPDVPGTAYVDSIMMVAKVSPPAATNITYGWGRVYQDRSLIITNVASATPPYWYVKAINNSSNPTGYPTPVLDTDGGLHQTTTSSPKSVLYSYDTPGMGLTLFQGCNTNDYAYEKTDFTYFLTNYVGSASTVAVQHVGQWIATRRVATTGSVASQWTGIKNIMCTTNIPTCNTITTAEIRTIVGGTNAIVIDPNATNNNPNP